MNWKTKLMRLIGKPIGISFEDGRGTSGVLCGVRDNVLYVNEYLYSDKFALKHYPFYMINDVNEFPACRPIQAPPPPPPPPPRPRPNHPNHRPPNRR